MSSAPPLPGRPVLTQRWTEVVFLHWPYRPSEVQRLLPHGLTVDTFEGDAWVGLVPFRMEDLRPTGLPAVPGRSRFVEVNVRTYVLDPLGRPGVWFFSLDVPQPEIVALARLGIGARYCLARVAHSVQRGPARERVGYGVVRRWPGQASASARIEVEVGSRIADGASDALALFLTARWAALTSWAGRLLRSPVAHEPWPLYDARCLGLEHDLVHAAGLTHPVGEPLVHFSPGVRAAFSRPQLASNP